MMKAGKECLHGVSGLKLNAYPRRHRDWIQNLLR